MSFIMIKIFGELNLCLSCLLANLFVILCNQPMNCASATPLQTTFIHFADVTSQQKINF